MDKKWSTEFSRRTVLKGAAAAAAAPTMFNINHAWSKDVMWDGQPFNAGGAVLRMADGADSGRSRSAISAAELREGLQLQDHLGFVLPVVCEIRRRRTENPPYGIANWNLKDMYQTARAGDFFLPLDDVLPTSPRPPISGISPR